MLLRSQYAMAGLLLILGAGCANTAMPRICDPPSASTQMARAKKFDPFPDPTIAPPILGGRPLGFREPRPEPDITKNYTSAWQRGYLVWPFASSPPPAAAPTYTPGAVPYAPATPAPIPGNVAYPPATAPYDPYSAPGSPPAAYGTAISQ